MIKDYYKILELERTCSARDIKDAYHRLLRKYHPDKNPGNPDIQEKFEEVVEAYSVLGNLDRRLDYSRLLNKKIVVPKYIDHEKNNRK
jgi:DnaJ-class molecular chaperone